MLEENHDSMYIKKQKYKKRSFATLLSDSCILDYFSSEQQNKIKRI